MDGASQPALSPTATATTTLNPTNIDAHNRRAAVSTQTGALLYHKTDTLYVSSSRGFGRELPPTRPTRPSLKNRRYTIDVVVSPDTFPWQKRRDPSFDPLCYEQLEEQLTRPPPREDLEQLQVAARETDEPLQRRPQLPLPDPLRYRDFHRWGHIAPPQNEATYVDVGRASLTNADLHTIVDLTGPDCWYRDSVLDVALELTSLYYGCEEKGIAVASSMTAQCLRFAADAPDAANMTEFREYKAMFSDKDWIFSPLNDGYGETSTEATQGCHWALLAIDRRHRTAHYIDSLFSDSKDWQKLAWSYSRAYGNLLGEEYKFEIEWLAPHQWTHNGWRGADSGPCGPFVVKMVEYYIKQIIIYQNNLCVEGEARDDLPLKLGYRTLAWFRQNFNSYKSRWYLVYTLAGVRASLVAHQRTKEHDEAALEGLHLENIVNLTHAEFFVDAPLFDGEAPTIRYQTANRLKVDALEAQLALSSSGGVTVHGDDSKSQRWEPKDGVHENTNAQEVDMTDLQASAEDDPPVIEITSSPPFLMDRPASPYAMDKLITSSVMDDDSNPYKQAQTLTGRGDFDSTPSRYQLSQDDDDRYRRWKL